MKEDMIEKVLDSEFKDGTERSFREFLADCIIQLFVDADSFNGKRAASNSDWYHVACECLLPMDGKIGHYEDYNETEKEFVLDDYKAADKALIKIVNRTLGTSRKR